MKIPKLSKPTLEYIVNYIGEYMKELEAAGHDTSYLKVLQSHFKALLDYGPLPEDYFGSEQEKNDKLFIETFLGDRKSDHIAIPMKQRDSCALFRCLRCFQHIFPDDDIEEYGDGYIHKVCAPIPKGSDEVEIIYEFGKEKWERLVESAKNLMVDQYYGMIKDVRDTIKSQLGLSQRQLIYILSENDNDLKVITQISNRLMFMLKTGRIYDKLYFRFKIDREGLMKLGSGEKGDALK